MVTVLTGAGLCEAGGQRRGGAAGRHDEAAGHRGQAALVGAAQGQVMSNCISRERSSWLSWERHGIT
eukprot:COSAG01_NODE_2000_length_8686_cov_3.000116_5_plen_67_part_00